MSKYSKSIAAGIGLIAILAREVFGLQVDDKTVDTVIQIIMAAATLGAVYQVPNK